MIGPMNANWRKHIHDRVVRLARAGDAYKFAQYCCKHGIALQDAHAIFMQRFWGINVHEPRG
jgi:hypothetical protein